MHYRRLGKSGLKVSALSYGSWLTFGNHAANHDIEACLKLAYDAGVNFFDNAEAYGSGQSEKIMGAAISKLGWDRGTYLVSSKVFWGGDKPNQTGLSRKHVIEACHAALRRLRVDYLDLYYCHRPDPDTPIEETVRAMDTLIQQGKVLYWGTSEWSAQQIMQAYAIAREFGLASPSAEQPQYNLLVRQRVESEYQGLYSEIGLGATTYSPLAGGVLTGKYNDTIPEDSRIGRERKAQPWIAQKLEELKASAGIDSLKQLEGTARKLGGSLAQLSIAWILKNPNVSSVILGATRPEQLMHNLQAIDLVDTLTEEIMSEIELVIAAFREA